MRPLKKTKKTLASLASSTAEMEMTPMIDVTFLLLVFFMCTLKFKTLEGRLAAYLPREEGVNTGAATPLDDVDLRLEVRAPGRRLAVHGDAAWSGAAGTRYRFSEERRLTFWVGPRRYEDLEAAGARLRELRRASPGRQVALAAAEGVVHSELVAALDRVLECGFDEVRLVGAEASKGPRGARSRLGD